MALSPWNDATFAYSILQLYKGYNPSSKLEVVSGLNLSNQARQMYHFNHPYCTERYYPKVYIGTVQTIATGWNYDYQNIENHPSIWPEVKPQKGEANTEGK